MIKIKCMLDKVQYKEKPQGKEIGIITNRLVESGIEISIDELAHSLVNGQTFKPSLMNGKGESDWMEQQLFALDFDENTTIEQELNRCKELNVIPVFIYTSFSHTEEHHKFRMVFCTDIAITDYSLASKIQLTLMNLFPNCDEKCKNLSRLYFGGRQLIFTGYCNIINHSEFLEKYAMSSLETVNEKCPPKSIDNSRIPILLGGQKPNDDSKDNYYNIKAIRDRNVEYLKKKINNPHIILENNEAFFEYIKGYDLGKLLEIKFPTSFRCIFHEDNHPSAGIFVNDEGTYIYHCFSCNKSYNIINLIEALGNFQSRPKAYKFIREIFNLEIQETEWQKDQKDILLENLKVLNNGELEKNCPQAYKNIKSNIRYLNQFLLVAIDNVYSDKYSDNDNNVVFYVSNKYLCKLMGINEGNSKEISKKNALFAYHNLLNKVDDNEVNEDMLKRSKAISINSDEDNKKYRHINFYSIPSYTTNLFEEIERQGLNWKLNNYTIKGISREMFYRGEGSEIANKLYPQYKQVYDYKNKTIVDRTTTIKSDKRTERIVKIIFGTFTIKPWVTEKEIIDELIADDEIKITKSEAERQLKKSLKEILDGYDLKRIRCNNQIKEQYGISVNGYPFIIVKNV